MAEWARHGHSERELLLAYLDGELPARKARQVQCHLQACWECRAELEDLQKTVAECVRYRRDVLGESLPPPPLQWPELTRGFAQVDAAMQPKSVLSRPLVRWAAVFATAASLAAATFVLRTALRSPSAPALAPAKALSEMSPAPAINHPRTDGPVPSVPGRRQQLPETAPQKSVPVASVGDELQAVAVLHQLGADLGEPLEITRDGPHVVITGTALPAARRRQIEQALAGLPQVMVRFSEPSPQPDEPRPTAALPKTADDAPKTSSPASLLSRVELQLGGHAQFQSFSARTLEQSDAAMARVYALRRLAQEFSPDVERQLSPGEERLLYRLAKEHTQALMAAEGAIGAAVSPLLTALGATPVAAAPIDSKTWQVATEKLFGSARQTDTLLAALLGVATPDQPTDAVVPQLAIALAQLQADVQQCDLSVSR